MPIEHSDYLFFPWMMSVIGAAGAWARGSVSGALVIH